MSEKNAKRPERLYNGIESPPDWPPRNIDPACREPMIVPYLYHRPRVAPIDVGRQLFVDNFLIETTTLIRRFHQPEKFEGNPVLKPETEAECRSGLPVAVGTGGTWWDTRERQFRMWYNAGWAPGSLSLAVSDDAMHWSRPELKVVKHTNQVLKAPLGQGCSMVWIDDEAPATERYKLLHRPANMVSTDWRGMVMVSADGIRWSKPVKAGVMRDVGTFFFNPFRRTWVYSLKHMVNRARCRLYHEHEDFMEGAKWAADPKLLVKIARDHGDRELTEEDVAPRPGDGPIPVPWTYADDRDEPGADPPQLYNHNAIAYESLLLGQFMIHKGPPNRVCALHGIPKQTDLCMGFSRDGFHWHRPDRRPFIGGTGQAGTWDRGYLQTGGGICVIVNEELWFFYGGFAGDESLRAELNEARDGDLLSDEAVKAPNGMHANGATGFARLRRDGFASMQVGRGCELAPGFLTTRLVTFKGRHLFVNVKTAGELRVECREPDGRPIAPFTLANCVPVTGDHTRVHVQWKGGADLEALRGTPVSFHFTLTEGDLYAFWVSKNERGASDGYLAAGGPDYKGYVDEA